MLSLQQLSYRPRDVGPLSLTLSSGQMVWIAGASGSGKSTLCALLTGDLEPSDGQSEGSLGRVATISSEVESHLLGATVRQELDWVPRVSSSLRSPGLEALEARWRGREEEDPHTLSRGEQQLLLLCAYARGDFQTLILDESLSCLDHQAFVLVMECLRLLTEGGRLVLVVSHEARVLPWVDRCLGLGEGRLII